MGTFRNRWKKLAASKKYREAFVAANMKQTVPFQIRALMKAQDLSQAELAQRAGLTQGAISRAANPTYGNLSLNTVVRIAAGFDVAVVCRFVSFGELDRWLDRLHEESTTIPDFETENAHCEDLFEEFDEDYRSVDRTAIEGRLSELLELLKRARENGHSAETPTNLVPPEPTEQVSQSLQLPANDVQQPTPPTELYGRTDRPAAA
jgi:transcriptional regulator with XRE-family HTH domain